MSSIVIELQGDALNRSTETSDLLRKALVVASKLDINDLKAWIENELSGYTDSNSLPNYRRVTGQVMAQDCWGRWVPVVFQSTDMANTVSSVPLWDSVPEIEALLERAIRQEGGDLSIEFTPEQEALLASTSENELVRHTRFIRIEELRRILDSVRNRILTWSLALEKDGILGEAHTFSKQEQQKAAGVHYTTNFLGSVGNVSQHGRDFSQTAKTGIQSSDLARLVAEFTDHLGELGLDGVEMKRAEAQVATLKAQLSDEPNPVIVREAVRTLRNVTEGAIGSLIATAAQPAIWIWVHEMLKAFQ